MKNSIKFVFGSLFIIFIFISCTDPTEPAAPAVSPEDNPVADSVPAVEPPVSDDSDLSADDDLVTYSAGDVSFSMVKIPGGITFPTGVEDGDTDLISSSYLIGESEVTFELWSEVYVWASGDTNMNGTIDNDEIDGIYTFANAGSMGDGNGDTNKHPVTIINWRDAMVWCNALTEAYNGLKGTDYKCVYYSDPDYTTPIRVVNDTSGVYTALGSQDHPYLYSDSSANLSMENCTANGFRLLSESEWELAARYIGDFDNDQDICDPGEYYTGDHASGADVTVYGQHAGSDYDGDGDIETTTDVAVISSNSGSSTSAVKEMSPNALGIYDMTGNVSEMCFDFNNAAETTRSNRGSHYDASTANYIRLGYQGGVSPYNESETLGFRLARTQ